MLNTGILELSKYRYVLIISACLLFTWVKADDVFLPYFWDEMAGYMSGILYMVDHGISLHPAAVPAEMSYGHPLLMHAVMATIIKIFGAGVYVMHSTTLIITFLLAWGVGLLAYRLSKDQMVSAFAILLFLVQPIVMAQSTQVLLEVFLTMLTVFALVFYMQRQFKLAVLFCTLGLMTKETGLVLAIAFLVHTLLSGFMGETRKQVINRLILFSIPFAVFAIFLLLQKQAHGWYLNPVNVGKSKLQIGSMVQKIWDYPLQFTFLDQGRIVLSTILLLALILVFLHKTKALIRVNSDLVLILIFSFGFLLFSSIADALERYFMMLMPIAAWAFSWACAYFKRYHVILPFILVVSGLAAGVLFADNGKRYSEADLSYRHMVKTNQALMDYLNSGNFKDDSIGFAFPLMYASLDPRFGYYTERRFISDTVFSRNNAYKTYCSPGNFDWGPPDTQWYIKVKEFKSGYSKSYLYKRKQ